MGRDENATTQSRGEERALGLWVVLARAHNAVAAHARVNTTRNELSPGEFGVLEALYHKGPLLLGDIQRKVLVSSGGVTYLVDRLQQRGLVERRPCATDRRATYAALTEEGEAMLDRIFPGHAATIAQAVGGLTAGEQETLTRLLRKLGLAAEEALPPAVKSS